MYITSTSAKLHQLSLKTRFFVISHMYSLHLTLFYPKLLGFKLQAYIMNKVHPSYTFFISMCGFWESNP